MRMQIKARWASFVGLLARHPRWAMAVKAAIAATAAWLIVLPWGGVADDYPYYAPFGAVIAVSATVARSFTITLQSVVAILIGAVLAFAAVQAPLPAVVSLALVVGVGTVLAGWHRLGSAGSWVPISALFVLIIGKSDRVEYVIAYLGLTSLGAAIGIGLNVVMPPLPLRSATAALQALRETLVDQLDDLAAGLDNGDPLTPDEWRQKERELRPRTREMRQMVDEVSESRLLNWRASRWRDRTDQQYQHAQALERLSLLIEQLTFLIMDEEHSELSQTALGPELREPGAQVLRRIADVLRELDGQVSTQNRIQKADRAVQHFADLVEKKRQDSDDGVFAAAAIVTALRQVVHYSSAEEQE